MKDFKASKSKVIDHVWYNPDTKILSVKFKNDAKHLYVGVTSIVFTRFKQSKSKGRFFSTNIRNNYPSQRNAFVA